MIACVLLVDIGRETAVLHSVHDSHDRGLWTLARRLYKAMGAKSELRVLVFMPSGESGRLEVSHYDQSRVRLKDELLGTLYAAAMLPAGRKVR